jgi:hypothetical protein
MNVLQPISQIYEFKKNQIPIQSNFKLTKDYSLDIAVYFPWYRIDWCGQSCLVDKLFAEFYRKRISRIVLPKKLKSLSQKVGNVYAERTKEKN